MSSITIEIPKELETRLRPYRKQLPQILERGLAQVETETGSAKDLHEHPLRMPDPAPEFHASYPDLQVPPELLALVGSQPARTIQQDKADLREFLAEKRT